MSIELARDGPVDNRYINLKIKEDEWLDFKTRALLSKEPIAEWALNMIRKAIIKEDLENG